VIFLGTALGLDTVSTTSSGIGLQLSSTVFALLFATSLVELLVVFFAWAAFRKLAVFDRRFSTPSKLTLLLAIALVIVIAALYPLLTQLNGTLTCINSTMNNHTAAAGCISGSLAALVLLVALAGLLALIGYIGLLMGIWRLGTRYDNGLFKAGAILTIIPVFNIVGAILVLVAAHSARERLDRAPSPVVPYR